MINFRIRWICFVVILIVCGGSAFAATKTWDGGGSGNNWSTANNWNPNGVPTGSDDVVINAPGTTIVGYEINTSDRFDTLDLQAGTYQGALYFGVNSSTGFTLSGGTLDLIYLQVGRNNNATLTQTGGNVISSSNLYFGEGGFGGYGTYNMSGGTLEVTDMSHNNGEFNFSGGVITLDGNQLPWDSGRAWFNVTGPNAGSYTETYAGGFTTLQIPEGPTTNVIITELDGYTEVEEGGATDSYEIKLGDTPSATVTVTADPCDSEIDIGSGPGVAKILVFTTSDWDTPQTVTVTAFDDTVYEGGAGGTAHITTIDHTALQPGGDSEYNGISISVVDVSVIDNDLTCGDWGYLIFDMNSDCYIDLFDFAEFAKYWLDTIEF